jgi:hypothetical protein
LHFKRADSDSKNSSLAEAKRVQHFNREKNASLSTKNSYAVLSSYFFYFILVSGDEKLSSTYL